MIVDVRTQLWDSPEQLGVEAERRLRMSGGQPWEKPDPSPEAFDAAMKRVDYAILHGFVSRSAEAALPGRQIAGYVARHPEKYIGFAGLDPMDEAVDDALDEAVGLGLSGVTISPASQDYNPTHTRAMNLYERCTQLGMPVFVLPSIRLSPNVRMEFGQPYLLDEVARSFPDLRLVIAQIGHPWIDQTLVIVAKHENVYADLSEVADRPWQLYTALLAAHQQGVIHRLLLGSNYPFSTPERVIEALYSINRFAHGTNLPTVPREQLRSIVERDALACLGIPASVHDRRGRVPDEAEGQQASEDGTPATGQDVAGENPS